MSLENLDLIGPKGKFPDSLFYIQEEHRLLNGYGDRGSIYGQALKMEIKGTYELDGLTPKDQLKRIKKEIIIRFKISAHEVFKYGELFLYAKRPCRLSKIPFKQWIRDNFDISYETVRNFMSVYQMCLGMRSIAVQLPISMLYKISAPNFPEELRDFLFSSGIIEDITMGELTGLTDRYIAGGFEAIQEDIENWNRNYYLIRECQYALDLSREALQTLRNLSKRINRKYHLLSGKREVSQEAYEIIGQLDDAIYQGIVPLEKIIGKTETTLFDLEITAKEALVE